MVLPAEKSCLYTPAAAAGAREEPNGMKEEVDGVYRQLKIDKIINLEKRKEIKRKETVGERNRAHGGAAAAGAPPAQSPSIFFLFSFFYY